MARAAAPARGADRRLGRRHLLRLLALAFGVAVAGCGGGEQEGSGDAAGGLAQLADEFLRVRHDLAPLLAKLQAELTDYGEVFTGDTVVAAIRHYDGYWRSPRVLGPTDRHSAYRLSHVTTEELAAGTGAAPTFPAGYRDVAPRLQPGLTVHRITFHEPGQSLGIDLDALVSVAGRLRLLPTPWLVLDVDEPGHSH
ncbi:hypothetical protein GCM10017691_20800 [Pseudonocardia petroleophila]|uniref:Uncharacterized protein n=1 Tax=Pseudonocardia petroleophila TaxID=37331 RepID=A0A7G7MGM9_9PSEU|nr:hypothetical protein [Pseudonocardia petroleophila]QNG51940.1 hypothetical protein H6H00_28270 [Pseudonocardia petroleophila]